MVKFQWAGGSLWQRLKRWVDEEMFICRITYWSLFYNSTTSWNTVVDAAMEPVFWSVDHIVRMMGPAFVVAVVCLTTSVVAIFYVCLLPHKYERSVPWTIYHLIVGHWLLANIVFNYFKAAFTSPGRPPRDVPSVSSICKKCIAPKPPRAHHCSVCDTCVLKMDHHCPWLNNCVGHFNHRYFFLFCMYMWLGTVYVSLCAYPLFAEHFYGDQEMGISGFFYPFIMAKDSLTGASRPKIKKESSIGSVDVQEDPVRETPSPTRTTLGMYGHHFIMYEFMLCSAVSIALLLLLCWHARLVTRAETSIEVHTNHTEKKRLWKKGLVFRNPYNFGFKRNWKKFLGITHGRSFLYHVLLPSSHPPDEDGLVWNTTLQSAESELLNI